MNFDKVEQLTNGFIGNMRLFAPQPDLAKDLVIVLVRHGDEGWSLEAKQKPVNRRDYVLVIEIPEDYFKGSSESFYCHLSTHIAVRLGRSIAAINGNMGRSKEKKAEIARKNVEARWAKKKEKATA